MNFELKKENGNTVITLNTRLDSTTAQEFDSLLQKEVPLVENALILNFKNVDFISSIGLRVLVAAYRALNGKELIITDANSSVKEIIKLSGLLSLFSIK